VNRARSSAQRPSRRSPAASRNNGDQWRSETWIATVDRCGPGGSASVRRRVRANRHSRSPTRRGTNGPDSRKHRWRQRFGTWLWTSLPASSWSHFGPSGPCNLATVGINGTRGRGTGNGARRLRSHAMPRTPCPVPRTPIRPWPSGSRAWRAGRPTPHRTPAARGRNRAFQQ
jgi:hypothetical protein